MPLILGLSVIGINRATNIQLHDTYYVVALFHVGLMLSIILGVIGLLYWFFRKKKLIPWMTFIHVTTTILCFVGFMLSDFLFKEQRVSEYNFYNTVHTILSVLLLISIASQLLFLVNLIVSLIRKKRN